MCNSITDTTRQYILPPISPQVFETTHAAGAQHISRENSLKVQWSILLARCNGDQRNGGSNGWRAPNLWILTFILLKRSNLVTSAKAWPEGPPGYCESLVLGWLFISLACHSSSYGCYNMTQIYSNSFLIPLAICENVVKLLQFIETPIKNRTLKCIKKAEGPDHQPMVECSKYLWTWSHGWSHRWLPITQELLRLHVLWAQRTTC